MNEKDMELIKTLNLPDLECLELLNVCLGNTIDVKADYFVDVL